jgi:hypothetical protein
MDPKPLLLTQACKPGKNSDHEPISAVEPVSCHSSRESSSESLPVRRQRPSEQTETRRGKGSIPGKRYLPDATRSTSRYERRLEQSNTQRGTAQSIPVSLKASTAKPRKKPGPQPKIAKPLKKNDAEVKVKIIREIEEHWGKNFITVYIPRCHHPLVKSTKGKKHRSHENDPRNWLPSILKSILVIAKLTQNKAWLKKAMNDVVRHRIKYTGNRKPQLTTTDFDVLEDMLTKGWKVEYSFPIRYKHLEVKGKSEEVNDEDIDNIMGRRVRSITSSEEGTKSEDEYSESTEDSEFNGDDSADEDDYTEALQDHPSSAQQRTKEAKTPKQPLLNPNHDRKMPSLSEQQSMYGYTHASASNPWNHSTPGYGSGPMNLPPHAAYNGYALYRGLPNYGSYSGYKPPNQGNGEYSQPWAQYGMNPWSPHPSSRPLNNSAEPEPSNQPAYRPTLFSPPIDTHSPRETTAHNSPSSIRQSLEPRPHAQTLNARPNTQPDLATHPDGDEAVAGIQYPASEPVDDEAAAIEAELRATELELKIARLKARQAALKLQARGR